ncbi:MAG: anthranilate phosphoribosyltransferase, partial [Synechococcaceae cyanobacterium]|nr:anthranilate phosphoribosyltransferase [Synechococcaceae cyanobacterium]
MAEPLPWPALLEHLLQGESLGAVGAEQLMRGWLDQQLEPVQTGAFLAALRMRPLAGEELAAMARPLRQACPLPCERPPLAM